MGTHLVARASEIAPGERKIVQVEGRSIGVFNIGGEYFALRNVCPHQGAPLCLGQLTGTALPSRPGEYRWAREGEILVCPWHAWEFDVRTGRSVFNPHLTRVKAYDVSVERRGEAPALEGTDAQGVDTFALSVADGAVLLHL